MMVEAVEIGVYISFYKPVCPRKGFLYLHYGCLTTPVWSEPVRFITEYGFINTFQNHLNDFLLEFVIAGLNAQQTFFIAVFLGNIYPLCRLGTVTPVS